MTCLIAIPCAHHVMAGLDPAISRQRQIRGLITRSIPGTRKTRSQKEFHFAIPMERIAVQ